MTPLARWIATYTIGGILMALAVSMIWLYATPIASHAYVGSVMMATCAIVFWLALWHLPRHLPKRRLFTIRLGAIGCTASAVGLLVLVFAISH